MENDQLICAGNWVELRKRGRTEYVSRVRSNEIAEIIALVGDDNSSYALLIVEQYREALQKRVFSLPAGSIADHDSKEKPKDAAKRELLEETGYRAGKIEFITSGPSSAGMSCEMVSFFIATDLTKETDGGGVEDENITVHVVPVNQLYRFLGDQKSAGHLVDYRIYAGMNLIEMFYDVVVV